MGLFFLMSKNIIKYSIIYIIYMIDNNNIIGDDDYENRKREFKR